MAQFLRQHSGDTKLQIERKGRICTKTGVRIYDNLNIIIIIVIIWP